jgi:hypothetical protein
MANKPNLIRDPEQLLKKFNKPEDLIQGSALFSRVYMTLCTGECPYKIIEQLVGMVEGIQEQLIEIVENKTPAFGIKLTPDTIKLLFEEKFLSGDEFPDW